MFRPRLGRDCHSVLLNAGLTYIIAVPHQKSIKFLLLVNMQSRRIQSNRHLGKILLSVSEEAEKSHVSAL